jgi:hypothetical protein
MKSKYAIIREEYNPETFESLVEIETSIGRFIGTTVAEECDQQCPSMWHGNQIALGKAQKSFAKAAIRILKAEVAVYENCLNCLQPVDHFWDEKGYNNLNKEYHHKLSELHLWQERLHNVGVTIQQRVAARDRITQTFIKKNTDEKD